MECVRIRCMEINSDELAVDTLLMGHRTMTLLWTASDLQLTRAFVEPLRQFSIALPSLQAMRSLLFQYNFDLSSMVNLDLYIAFPSLVSKQELKLFAAELSRLCFRLSSLSLTMVSGIRSPSDLPLVQVIDFDAIQPFLGISSIESFRMTHTYPLLILDSEIRTLFRSWPLLQSLYLNPNPVVLIESRLTMACISTVIRDCPRLEEASLYVDAQSLPRVWMGTDGRGRLRKMCIGMSPFPINDGPDTWWSLVEYLAAVVPASCNLSTGFVVEDLDIHTYMVYSRSRSRFIVAPRWQLFNCHKGWNSVFSLVRRMRHYSTSFSLQYFPTTLF